MKNTERVKRLQYVSILLHIPNDLLGKFDQYCEDNSYKRAEGIRHAIRKKLKNPNTSINYRYTDPGGQDVS
jgi:metal-responsive CopG/Arc/MetJ family transcriptional regulator